ncbi:MAG: hypothetical protein IJT21_07250 [Synergistaceae bacterium]|nr:hypothetical protein [Synergistaceae bacterium]
MAKLRDSNGRIVIDEAEAEADAKKIELARAKLEEARSFLDRAKLDSNRMHGDTLTALEEVYSKLSKDFNTWEERCTLTAKYIRAVVNKYQRIDREYAQKIANRGHSSGGRNG